MDSDFEAWAQLRTSTLMRAAYLLGGDQQTAEDLVQGVLEKVLRAWPRIDGQPDAYARQVLHRLAMAGWRQRRRFLERRATVFAPVEPRAEGDDIDRRIVLERALRRLTPAQRSVLVLRFYEDLSEKDCAAILACSVGTVKSQTHKALASLRRDAPHLVELMGRDPSDVG